MAKTKKDLFEYLRDLQIETRTYEHEPAYTGEQAKKVCEDIPGCDCKNLFLKDKRGNFWLVVAKFETKIDLKKLAKHFSAGKLSFAKEEDLMRHLGVGVGSVTPFGLINDVEHVVNVVVEKVLFDYDLLSFHPLENIALTTISGTDFRRFLDSCENRVELFDPDNLNV